MYRSHNPAAARENSVRRRDTTAGEGSNETPEPGIVGNVPNLTPAPWRASLSLDFTNDGTAVRMTRCSHRGPLRVQKPLYPEGDAVCHVILLHPPGGAIGGDELVIRVLLRDHTAVFITTPGAGKWYKANGRVSRQEVRLDVGAGSILEWLPQGTIFFNGARVRLDHTVSLADDAIYIGCEILCFGRTASGESFRAGRIEQCTSIRRNGKLLWFEQGALDGDGACMESSLALAGKTVCATLIAVGEPLPASVLNVLQEEVADLAEPGSMYGATQMRSVLVVRYLGDSSETAKHIMLQAWQRIRPELTGRQAVVPRIWNT